MSLSRGALQHTCPCNVSRSDWEDLLEVHVHSHPIFELHQDPLLRIGAFVRILDGPRVPRLDAFAVVTVVDLGVHNVANSQASLHG